MNISGKIVGFVCEYGQDRSVPWEIWERVKAAILDYIGATLAGVGEESSEIVRGVIHTWGGNPQATIWGAKYKTSVALAALANGTAAHALDYDDTNSATMAHPSIQLLPALFALGEFEQRSGNAIMAAYLVGFEVGAKLGRALNPNLIFQGWFPVGTLGTLMQTVACAKLLGLTSSQVKMALGIAANLASGLRCNNGTMAKPLMAGMVGSNGILAARLALGGMTANQRALEDRFGFFENFSHGDIHTLGNVMNSLGDPLEIIQSGISHKLYPCCAGSHLAIDCTLDILRSHPINPEDIERIEISLSSHIQYVLIHPRPQTEMEAKFSLEYCVSRAILDGQLGLKQFTPEKINDPVLQNIIEKVEPRYYDASSTKSRVEMTHLPMEVKIHMKDGAVYSSRASQAKGTPGNPLSWEELESKFFQCCRGRLSEKRIQQVADQVRHFERLENVADLIAMLDEVQETFFSEEKGVSGARNG